jgi:CRP-like cAMP-binding protein
MHIHDPILHGAADTRLRSELPSRRTARTDASSAAAARALGDLLLKAVQPLRLTGIAAQALAHRARRHRVERGSPLLRRGEDCRSLWLLERGTISMGHHDAMQHWYPTRSVRAGEWVDAWSAWSAAPLVEGAIAESDCLVWELPIADIEHVAGQHPGTLRAMLALCASRVRRLTEEKHGLLSQDVLARCAQWLLDALPDTPDGTTVVLNQRKRSIAAQIGATPETFSRMLRQLRERHAIDVEGYRIRVCDPAMLRQLAADGAQRRPLITGG